MTPKRKWTKRFVVQFYGQCSKKWIDSCHKKIPNGKRFYKYRIVERRERVVTGK
jgi:hypothetical protein